MPPSQYYRLHLVILSASLKLQWFQAQLLMAVGQLRKPAFKIRSCDGDIFIAQDWLIQKSKCFSVVYPYMKDSAQPLQTTVSSFIFEKIVQWCYHHRNNDDSTLFQRTVPEWDAQFLQSNNAIVLHLIEAAYRLEIKGLLNIACRAVSTMLGKSLTEVKVMLRVAEPEEILELEIRADNEAVDVEAEMIPAISAA
ncbi:hypothetical protein L5515_018935 [Caenorhabditis briggsae]|uniref:Skp1-related protein n=1 Tax=Caenorhabditis briggsae TaxID=6238 RepID=A0AAE9FJA5_CAEBR|nr:hypothetical protein L5515_018935 [Caenorhabditis briggsae]